MLMTLYVDKGTTAAVGLPHPQRNELLWDGLEVSSLMYSVSAG